MWSVQNSLTWLMYFDLFECLFKMCVGGKYLGAHFPPVTQRRVILAVGRAKHAGLTALHSYLWSKYIQIMMGHTMHCYWQHWNCCNTALKMWPGRREMARPSTGCFGVSFQQFQTALVNQALTSSYILKAAFNKSSHDINSSFRNPGHELRFVFKTQALPLRSLAFQ